MSELAVRHVAVTDADSPSLLADVGEYVRLVNAVCSHDAGHDDLSTATVVEALGMLRDRADRRHELFIAERDGGVVGTATTISAVRGAEALEIDIVLDPSLPWDDEAADALLGAADGVADECGLGVVQTWTLHRPDPPVAALTASTGVGAIDAAAPLASFLARRGFTLEQVERNSRFDLGGSFARVEELLADALVAAGPDYAVASFTDRCPDELVDSLALTIARMSTDAPQGGTVVEPEEWDRDRVRRREDRMRGQGLTSSMTLAVHTPTGEVAAYNELVLSEDRAAPVHQYGTLVVREHRGRRLGMVVKCAGLVRVRAIAPDARVVSTFNAEENAHMLAINVALGFTPASYAGAWKRVSGASGSAGRSGSSGS